LEENSSEKWIWVKMIQLHERLNRWADHCPG